MKKSWLIRGHTLALLFALVLIFSLALSIAPTTPASAATVINNQINALDTTAGPGSRLAATQSENFKFYEVAIAAAIALGPGQKFNLLTANKNTLDVNVKFYAKDDLSLLAPLLGSYGLRNDIAVAIYGKKGRYYVAG